MDTRCRKGTGCTVGTASLLVQLSGWSQAHYMMFRSTNATQASRHPEHSTSAWCVHSCTQGGFSVSRTPSQRLAAGTASTSGVRHSTSRASANRTAPGTCAPGAASPGPSQRRGPGPRSEGSLPMLAPEFRAQPPISPQPSPHRGLRVTDGDRPVSPQLSPRGGQQGRGGPQGLALDPALLTVGSRTTRFRHLPTNILDADSDSDEEDGEEKRAEKGKGVEGGKAEPGGGKSGGDTAVQGEPSHGREAAASSSSSGDKQAAPPAAVVDAPLRTAFSSSGGGAAAAAAAGAGAGVAAASPLSPAALAALRCASVSSGGSTRSGSGRMGAASSRRSSLDAYLLNAASASASTGGRGSGRSGLSPGQELTASMLLDTYLCGHPLMARTSSSGLHDLLTGRSTDTTNSTNSKASLAAATAAGLFVSTARATVHSYGSRAPSLISFLESAAPPVAAPAAGSTDPRLDPGTGAATAVAAEERGLPTRDGSAGGGSRDAAGAGRGRSAVNLPGTTFSFGHRKAAELQQGPGAAPGSPLALYPGVAALYGSVPGARPGEQTASGYGGGDVSAERLERRFIDRTLQAQKQQYLDAMHNLQRSYLNTTPPGPTSAPLAATRSGVGSGSGFGQSSSSQACSTSKSPWSPRSPDASKPLPALQDPSAWTEEGYSSAPLTGAALAAARGASRRTSTQRKPAKRRPSGRVLPYPGPSGGGGGGGSTDAHAQVGGNGGGHPGAQVMLCRTDSGPLKGLAQPDSPLAGGGKVRMMFNASFTSSRNLSFHGSDAGSGGSGASNTSSTWAAITTPAQGVTPPHLGPEVHAAQGGGASRRLLKAGAGAGVGAEGASPQTSPTRESRLSGRMTTAEAASAPAATAAGRGPTLHLQNSPPQKLLHVLMAKQRRASVSSVPGGASGSAPATTAAAAPALVPALSSPGALTAEVVPKPAPSLKSGQGMGGQARGEAESATPMGKSTAGAKKGIKVKVAQWADKLTHLFGRK